MSLTRENSFPLLIEKLDEEFLQDWVSDQGSISCFESDGSCCDQQVSKSCETVIDKKERRKLKNRFFAKQSREKYKVLAELTRKENLEVRRKNVVLLRTVEDMVQVLGNCKSEITQNPTVALDAIQILLSGCLLDIYDKGETSDNNSETHFDGVSEDSTS